MTMRQTDPTTAPPGTLCANCGCRCGGELVTTTLEYSRVADREIPTYRHVTATQCLMARQRAERVWHKPQEQAR